MYLCYIQVTKTEYDILSSNYSFIVAIRGLITLVDKTTIAAICPIIIGECFTKIPIPCSIALYNGISGYK